MFLLSLHYSHSWQMVLAARQIANELEVQALRPMEYAPFLGLRAWLDAADSIYGGR